MRIFFLGLIISLTLAIAAMWVSSPHASNAASNPTADAAVTTAYGPEMTAYAQVNRTDGTYRRMLVPSDQLVALQADAPLPDGTRILMETYYSPGQVGTVFHKQKRDGRWQYGSFPASRPDLSVRNQASCLACHARTSDTDFTFTRPSLDHFISTGAVTQFICERGGRSPCAASVYQAGAKQ